MRKRLLLKVLTLVLTLTLALGSLSVSASENDVYATRLKTIDVFNGTGSNDFQLDREPTRLEGLIMFIRLLGAEEDALSTNNAHPFDDVPLWASKYVGWAYKNGYTNGISTTKFGTGNMEAKSYLTLMLRSLGYKDSEGDFTWNSAVNFSNSIGLVTSTEAHRYNTKVFMRDDVAKISYDILSIDRKEGTQLAKYLINSGALLSSKISSIGIEVENPFMGYTQIEVGGGDLSGYRKANVVVDIGFGEREYYAFTNEHGQLVKVIASQITLQDEVNEPVTSSGRYYYDEAKVPGTESPNLDEGHVIADSLGGVANAYNITPQNSTLNRHGDQAYMENTIRKAGGCTDFMAIITYPNAETQIPSHYEYTYTINGQKIIDSFDNINPDEVNQPIIEEQKQVDLTNNQTVSVIIHKLDKRAEYVEIKNTGTAVINIGGWKMISEKGNQSYTFSNGTMIQPNQIIRLTSGAAAGTGNYTMANTDIWNNSSVDPAVLLNANGIEIDRIN